MSKTFVTTWCGKAHRLEDGKPIDHECFVLPTEALHAERGGDMGRALAILAGWKNRKRHKGIRSKGGICDQS